MRVCIINTGDNGSTGGICESLCEHLINNGDEALFIVKKITKPCSYKENCFSGKTDDLLNKISIKLSGNDCFKNKKNTDKAIRYLKEFNPEIVHIHNVHSYFLNIETIINYCFFNGIKIIWTLHDCWPFTGRCAHFDYNNCNKWVQGCHDCRFRLEYPSALLFDESKKMFKSKKQLFTQKNIYFVVPSLWLKNQFKRSFLSEEKVLIINNGIKERSPVLKNEIELKKQQLGITEYEKIVFSAAYPWSKQKGLEYIYKVSEVLKNERIIFIIGGLSKKVVKKNNIITLPKISSRKDMDLLYSLSDVFFNPTLQETSSLVNIEALLNGTPVVTFNTGGAPEIVTETTGIVVDKGDVSQSALALLSISKDSIKIEECKKRAAVFSNKKMLDSYYKLYLSLLNNSVQ